MQPRLRHMVSPPAEATWGDARRFGLGLLMICVGITILVRSIAAGVFTPPAVLTGLACLAFGVYRTGEGIVRYRMYRRQVSNALAPALTIPKGGCALDGFPEGRLCSAVRSGASAGVKRDE